MRLDELFNLLCEIAKGNPNIQTIVMNDIYRINELKEITYSVFCVAQTSHREDDVMRTYGLRLFYVDRLLEDSGNELSCQGTGIEVLSNIIKELGEQTGYSISEITYFTWTQRFLDECAGAYCEFNIEVPISACYETYYEGGPMDEDNI